MLLISSDFEEVEKVCHRALVFNRGRVTAELAGTDITVARLTGLAAGSGAPAEIARVSAPTRRAAAPTSSRLTQAVSVWGLLVLLVLLIVFFSVLKPDTFPTYFNMRSIINNKAISALLALAVFLPMTANHFDLSAGFLLGIAQVLVIGLQGQGLGWIEASALVLVLGGCVGLFNGLLVTVVGIDSFIATLGTGTLLYGFNEWYTGGQQVVSPLPDAFTDLSGVVAGIPLPALYVLALSVTLWIVFEYMPMGRHLYVLGANPRAAELNGISAKRYVNRRLRRRGGHVGLCRHRPAVAVAGGGRVRSGRSTCCPLSPPRCWGRRRSGPDASTSGAPSWPSRCWP